MVTSDTTCAALDHGGGVRFGPQTFAIYSCAPLPPSFRQSQLNQKVALRVQLNTSALQVCKTLLVHVDLDASEVAQLVSLPVPAQPPVNSIYHLPWFLINSARLEKHCVIGRGSEVESLLVILQRPWCVLEICCADNETIAAVRDFARLAAKEDPARYDVSVRLLSHELRARSSSVTKDTGELHASRCSVKALCDIYAAMTLVHSYNRFWLPLICSCAVHLGIPFSEVVRRICEDYCEGAGSSGVGRVDWIDLYRVLLGRIGDWMT
ncbi:hypothetical protein BDV12DRAFT_63388 [Aspergillus spectabilis]